MAAYCTIADLKNRISEEKYNKLVNYSGTMLAEADVADIITDAEDLINSYLLKRYTIPITSDIPPSLKNACINIVLYRLYERVGQADMATTIKTNYNWTVGGQDWIGWLSLVGDGKLTIPNLALKSSSEPVITTFTQSWADEDEANLF